MISGLRIRKKKILPEGRKYHSCLQNISDFFQTIKYKIKSTREINIKSHMN